MAAKRPHELMFVPPEETKRSAFRPKNNAGPVATWDHPRPQRRTEEISRVRYADRGNYTSFLVECLHVGSGCETTRSMRLHSPVLDF